MIILTTSSSEQTINVIPREGLNVNPLTTLVLLYNEDTKTTQTINVGSYSSNGYYDSIGVTFTDLIEGGNYILKIFENGVDLKFYDKVFCTDQTAEDYTINDSEYSEHETTNEYVIYE